MRADWFMIGLVLLFVDGESGTRYANQSPSAVKQNRHSVGNRSMAGRLTALRYIMPVPVPPLPLPKHKRASSRKKRLLFLLSKLGEY